MNLCLSAWYFLAGFTRSCLLASRETCYPQRHKAIKLASEPQRRGKNYRFWCKCNASQLYGSEGYICWNLQLYGSKSSSYSSKVVLFCVLINCSFWSRKEFAVCGGIKLATIIAFYFCITSAILWIIPSRISFMIECSLAVKWLIIYPVPD